MHNHTASAFMIIVGCGRVGAYLANTLSHAGHSVVVIDQDEAAFFALSADFSGFKLEGDATEVAVLTHAKASHADMLLAVSDDENANLMVAQIAKTLFQIPRLAVRVFDQQKGAIFQEDGIDLICTTEIVGEAFIDMLFSPQEQNT